MTKLLIMSDLHTEFVSEFHADVPADVVVLAGDIGQGMRSMEFIFGHFDRDVPVIFIPGNHEYYNQTSLQQTRHDMRRAGMGRNVWLLDRESIELSGVRFLGATLWTDYHLDSTYPASMVAARHGLVDHRVISYAVDDEAVPFSPELAEIEFNKSLRYLRRQLSVVSALPTVVVTHHAPSRQSIALKYQGSPLNPCFASNLGYMMADYQPALWVHGHVHSSFDYVINKTRVVCNPRGYPERSGLFENRDFDPGFLVEI